MEDARTSSTSSPGGALARAALRALGLVAAALLATACGGGGGGGSDPAGADPAGGRRGPDRDIQQPAGDDVEALEPILSDLLDRHDDVVNEVVADPAIARDEDDPLIQDYLALYSPDSEVPQQVMAAWVHDAEAGRSTHPLETGHPAIASRLDGDIETLSDDEVRFPTCNELRYAVYDADGGLIEMVPYREHAGEASAVRIDGEWLLLQLDAFEGQAACRARDDTEEPS
jgi:hypothetical protein